ncbi:hypothetical protein ABOM_006398 [Aspergillus bombycis]|uniref:ubiquitinyl hydrolase 1 n=1 Tax=Aspergillus bombycis TaxID=109264 RepID=A0A1F8A0Q9_9EURO|nr:hypothetical protein ABOM_006398 [Aspergillus bombycis]OGM45293.1 hypothetical protein ABOM_006398 [Aspergillus bombycis]
MRLLEPKHRTRKVAWSDRQPGILIFPTEFLPSPSSLSSPKNRLLTLQEFEKWVARHLDTWIKAHRNELNTCRDLSNLIQTYHEVAAPFYLGNPVTTSNMILTLMELWIACDKSAASIDNLILEYDVGIPESVFQCLLLRSHSQMRRLKDAEDYVRFRVEASLWPASLNFQSFGHPNSFSVKYFSRSLHHQELLKSIEAQAREQREAKRAELRQIKFEYTELQLIYNKMSCDMLVYEDTKDKTTKWHDSKCRKCAYRDKAEQLRISAHVWPLPKSLLEAQSAVFELQVPQWYGFWRDTALYMLLDVFKLEVSSKNNSRPKLSLSSYPGLQCYFQPYDIAYRLCLSSNTNPYGDTHKSIASVTENDVCLDNAIVYSYLDRVTSLYVDSIETSSDEVSVSCIYKLPPRSSDLQPYLRRLAVMSNGPPPNKVIASQLDCPKHMSFEEYIALTHLPLGFRLQWQNILVQLSLPAVDLRKVETTLFVLQTIYQSGPRGASGTYRESHEIISNENFTRKFIEKIENTMQSLEENWECAHALYSLICLTARVLTLSSNEGIRMTCLRLLAGMRMVSYSWVCILKEKMDETTRHQQRQFFMGKAVLVALICAGSFNIEQRDLTSILANPENLSILIHISIILDEGKNRISKELDPLALSLHMDWKRLLYHAYPTMVEQIANTTCLPLDNAIQKVWSAYRPSSKWKKLSEQACYWLVSQTAPQSNGSSLPVRYNLLTGELLASGYPLATLPPEYERHPIHQTLFGPLSIEAMPSAVPGMQFSSKKKYAGYAIHFGMVQRTAADYDIRIRVETQDSAFEVVPSRLLQGLFPPMFVQSFVHWYSLKDGHLGFCPVDNPWPSSQDMWRLVRIGNDGKWRLLNRELSLINMRSPAASSISQILSPLEDPEHIHVFLGKPGSDVDIELPRIQLSFQMDVDNRMIYSQQFRGYHIDTNQSLGALIGLRNRLILKHQKSESHLVIILEGDIWTKQWGDHMAVGIYKGSGTKAHSYLIDNQLGRLVDNGTLQSKLVLCYLHGLTSFCLPDPLTGKTGTEQALYILTSAAVQSFDPLTPENIQLLEKIAHLSPERKYHSSSGKGMQTVRWASTLGSLAQDGSFFREVKSLLDEKFRRKFLWSTAYERPPDWGYLEPDLLRRDLIRSSVFRVSGFGAEEYTHALDSSYLGRDRLQWSKPGIRALNSVELVYNERDYIYYPSVDSDALWDFHCRYKKNEALPAFEIGYDACYLMANFYQSVSTHWLSLHNNFASKPPSINKYKVMMWLATLAYADGAEMPIIQTLTSFYIIPEMVTVRAPQTLPRRPSDGYDCKKSEIESIVKSSCYSINDSPEANLVWDLGSQSAEDFQTRRISLFKRHRAAAIDTFTNAIMNMWPCRALAMTEFDAFIAVGQYVDMKKALRSASDLFESWYDNKCFFEYLTEIETLLGSIKEIQTMLGVTCQCLGPKGRWQPWHVKHVQPIQRKVFISIDDLFASLAPFQIPFSGTELTDLVLRGNRSEESMARLSNVIEDVEVQASSSYEEAYATHLRGSLESWKKHHGDTEACLKNIDITSSVHQHLGYWKGYAEFLYKILLPAASPKNLAASTQRQICLQIMTDANLWPRLSPTLFLEQLRYNRFRHMSESWKDSIISYGLALAGLQRAKRLLICVDNKKDLIRELENTGHMNWSPSDFPESLLLEVESGLMIRDNQEDIAQKMRNGETGKNTVLQLNMGEGKSSVIIPIVATSLANGSRLVRVIVAKPQAKQMFQMLVSKLGGMIGRRIYHLPFSRALKLDSIQAKEITLMCQECMKNGGVLLVQPEQTLSLKLMALERMVTRDFDVAHSLWQTLQFFNKHSRDVVDESDENFSAKFELMSPERWLLAHEVLELVRRYTDNVKAKFPHLVEVGVSQEGSFPRIRIFGVAAQRELVDCVATHICETGLSGFPIARQPKTVRETVRMYITKLTLTVDQIEKVETDLEGIWGPGTRDVLFLLRGLFAGGILVFAFGLKRWRVNYGLTSTREPPTKLAVPYRAKDNPTARSEYSHPDAVIVLTCLSWYYGGLSNEDLFNTFSHLLNTDQADMEYQLWVKDAYQLPKKFQQLVSINLEDRHLCIEKIFPSFRFSKSVVDYFLSHIVFPKELRAFPYKLSASGWDIGEVKCHPLTGFSGTNDSREVLPLSVEQLDLPAQMHTNALVLGYLLQPENSVVCIPRRHKEHRSDAEELLSLVMQMTPPVQVILDVGAQVLELTNAEVANEWLRLTSNSDMPQAVVFCDDNDELCVLDRKGRVELLQTSPFAKQPDVCYVFLDEAHTRGTDLKLPEHYRAAVTLGANLTKDRLVQACMRMRRLGQGQSVVFCVPDEIRHKIPTRASDNGSIEVSDVLCWAISETWQDMKRNIPLWATQGLRFLRHERLWNEMRTQGNIILSSSHARKFLEDETLSLEQRYRPRVMQNGLADLVQGDTSQAASLIATRCREFGSVSYHSAKMDEEQEREHGIHKEMKKLVTTGVIVEGSTAFLPAFQSLDKTSAARHLSVRQFPRKLLVTRDFAQTVEPIDTLSFSADVFQRPVQWILTTRHGGNSTDQKSLVSQMVIISPYEAQKLYNSIKESTHVTLHLYAPRSNLGLKPLDKLDLYNVSGEVTSALCMPRDLIIELNLFAGQLYLSSYEEYVEVCDFLGVAWKPMGEDSVVATDGFILRRDTNNAEGIESTFRQSPIKFLKALMSQIRRKGDGIDKTHMGKIFNGIILNRSDFEEPRRAEQDQVLSD